MAHLVRTTPAEAQQSLLDNVHEWRGALSEEAYFRREALLSSQTLTRDGGLTGWILTPTPAAPTPAAARAQFSACETLRKRALFASPATGVKDVTCAGVASVFCPPRFRGKGYASDMIAQLGAGLDADPATMFSVLYSDIGPVFYARHGWAPRASRHLALSPYEGAWPAGVDKVRSADVPGLCARDEELLRSRMRRLAEQGRTGVAIIPDEPTFRWQQARECFVAQESLGKVPEVQGARTRTAGGIEVWALWTRWWYNTSPEKRAGNALHVLRLVVEDESYEDGAATEDGVKTDQGGEVAKAIAAVLQAARFEAQTWMMEHVEIWNPSAATLAAARSLVEDTQVVSRDKESICSFKWCDASVGVKADEVEWVANEKFAWC